MPATHTCPGLVTSRASTRLGSVLGCSLSVVRGFRFEGSAAMPNSRISLRTRLVLTARPDRLSVIVKRRYP